MARSIGLLVAVLCYAAFFAAFIYLIGFVAGLDFLPTTVDKGLAAPPATAAVVDIVLIALFGLQHSVMARQGFKQAWTRVVPQPIERSIYCLATAAALALLFVFWHPIGGTVWSIGNESLRIAVWVLFALGWTILFIATHLLNHWELFGLAQAWRHFRGREAAPPKLSTPLFYRWVRHPIYSGFLLAFWAAPDMSYGHLLLSIGFTAYIFIGIVFEERDLVGHFGDEYRDYRRRVGAVVPGIGRRA
jgi:protein-S-isoprenylcysteine O-methyltransferase Ste14